MSEPTTLEKLSAAPSSTEMSSFEFVQVEGHLSSLVPNKKISTILYERLVRHKAPQVAPVIKRRRGRPPKKRGQRKFTKPRPKSKEQALSDAPLQNTEKQDEGEEEKSTLDIQFLRSMIQNIETLRDSYKTRVFRGIEQIVANGINQQEIASGHVVQDLEAVGRGYRIAVFNQIEKICSEIIKRLRSRISAQKVTSSSKKTQPTHHCPQCGMFPSGTHRSRLLCRLCL
ncbi:hypothetical protein QAD02_003462 [Eretmocerus hayati]|uniref:Uncharacterized protein n=1 Tax=Eretmocerus hayati TaxID=131215 RepID=A0ACC2NLX1_9HYME|nr:hypothetical protein QAD02_003462 [Eretmocerus hayati]